MGTITASGQIDRRSLQVEQSVRAEWAEKRGRPYAELEFLSRPEAIAILGAKTCAIHKHQIRKQIRRVRDLACSANWADAYETAGVLPPGLTWTAKAKLVAAKDGRRCSVRLVLSRRKTRRGNEDSPGLPTAEIGTRRWTPPQAAELEDAIDGMSVDEAIWKTLDWPASPSALAIQRCEAVGARPVDGKW